MSSREVTLTVNGRTERVTIKDHWTLLDLLRRGLAMRGTEEGCGEGSCGSCTVLVDGTLVRSCLSLAVRADGTTVETIEGMATAGELHPIQQAYVDCGGIQCGFCTPGFVMVTRELLTSNPDPTEQEVREFLAGNFCRCGGYTFILEAVQRAARTMRGA